MAALQIDSRTQEDVTVLYPRGYIDAHTVKEFERELQNAVQNGRFLILISGRELSYIASAGLGALMGIIEEVRSHQGDIRLADLSESVYNVFEILGFTHLFQIYPSEDEALRSFTR